MKEASINTTEEEIIRPAQATFTCTGTRLFGDVAEITLTPIPYHDEHNERFFLTYPSAKITLGNVRNARDLFRLGEDYRVVFEPVTHIQSQKE